MKHIKLFEQFINVNEGFKNTKDFEKFLEEIDGMGESQIKKIMGKDYIDTPGFYEDEKEDYDGIVDFMTSNMGKSDFEKLKKYWETHVSESLNEARIAIKHVYSNAPVRNKVLELLKNGRISESDFMDAVSKAGAPGKWVQRNSHYFKIEEEDGVKFYSLSKSGSIVSQAMNESENFSRELVEIYEEFGIEESLIVDPLDITKDVFYVSINGTTYGYGPKSGDVEELAKSFKGMLKYSAGKALAWLKRNADLVSGSKKAINEAEETLTGKDRQWVKSLGNDKIQYNDQQGSGDHTLSAILSLMSGGSLKWGGAADFGFDHVDKIGRAHV
jgi:hypothetical protein